MFRQTGDDLDVGEAMRYLAELVWVPPAILVNPALEWSQVGPNQLLASTRVGERTASVRLSLDDEGRAAVVLVPASAWAFVRRAEVDRVIDTLHADKVALVFVFALLSSWAARLLAVWR